MKKIMLLLLMLVAVINLAFAQKTITVDNTPGANAQYADLQSAINVAANNDIILVQPSETSYGDVTLNKPLQLIGYGHSDPEIRTSLENLRLMDGSSNSYISGFYLYHDIYSYNNETQITNIKIENNNLEDMTFYGGTGVTNIMVRGNIIRFNLGYPYAADYYNPFNNCVFVQNILHRVNIYESQTNVFKNNILLNENKFYNYGNADLVVQNNILFSSSTTNFDPNSTKVIYENCLSYNDVGSVTTLNGTNNINDVDPQFVNIGEEAFEPQTDDYHLQASSPAKGKGANGEDLGIYYDGAPFLFNNFGYTNGVPKVRITSLTSQVRPDGELEVKIETHSN